MFPICHMESAEYAKKAAQIWAAIKNGKASEAADLLLAPLPSDDGEHPADSDSLLAGERRDRPRDLA